MTMYFFGARVPSIWPMTLTPWRSTGLAPRRPPAANVNGCVYASPNAAMLDCLKRSSTYARAFTPPGASAVADGFGGPLAQMAPSSYAGCVGNNQDDVFGPTGQGVLYRNSQIRFLQITDGLSETIMVGDRAFFGNDRLPLLSFHLMTMPPADLFQPIGVAKAAEPAKTAV